MSAPQPDRSPVPRSGTTLLGSSRANGASGRKAGKAAAANLARRGSSKKQLTAAADDEAQDKITCCLCFFIVVSVILGVIAVTSISFIAFFQADFQSYENVYSEAAEFMGTDVLHQGTDSTASSCRTAPNVRLFRGSHEPHVCGE